MAFGCIALAALGGVCLAAWDIRASVFGYLILAKSHAWFELAFLAFFLAQGTGTFRAGSVTAPRSS